ncbi:MAG: GFA family protein [Rhizobiaceae bacterium]|nr:GFA family protein [Rhizobiaceae bacterium]
MQEITGSCLCGKVSIAADADIKMVINCHCLDCQNVTGSVHGTLVFVEETSVNVSGELSAFDHPADSGNTLTKFFCGTCGSQVMGKNTGRPGMVGLRAGIIDQKDLIKPGANIYCDSAVPSTAMDPELKSFPKMPG